MKDNMIMLLFSFLLLNICDYTNGSCSKESGKDINGGGGLNPVHNTPESGCCGICQDTSGCQAYSWNDYMGGTCWLKTDTGPIIDKPGVYIGIVQAPPPPPPSPTQGDRCEIQKNKDIDGADLYPVHNTAEKSCCAICNSVNKCKAYAWNNFEGGTCWLKSGNSQLIDRPGVNVGFVSGQSSDWKVLKVYKFNSMDQLRQDWEIKVWGQGYVNDEKQAYVDNPENVFITNGNLVLKAIDKGDWYFTSGRVETKARFTPTNVAGNKLRVEYVAKVPTVMGAWPALWMLGIGGVYGDWPQEGEIDVMEWVYQIGDTSKSALHWKGSQDWDHDFNINKNSMANEFNTYGVEYSSQPNNEYIQFYLITSNGNKMNGRKATPNDWNPTFPTCPNFIPGASRCSPLAPFDNKMYLILNVAVGGSWGGCCGVNDYSAFRNGVQMEIKSVTVYGLA